MGGDEEECQYFTFVKNLQGDVLGILGKPLDNAGVLRVDYLYDPWGRLLRSLTTAYDESAAVLAELNPFRYRGYLYDEESGLYYLRTRYYNPAWGRFVNADAILGTGSLLSHNIFAYCRNNPIKHLDSNGDDAIVAGQERAVGGFGHMSAFVQDSEEKWFYFYWGSGVCMREVPDPSILDTPDSINAWLRANNGEDDPNRTYQWMNDPDYDRFCYIEGDFSPSAEYYLELYNTFLKDVLAGNFGWLHWFNGAKNANYGLLGRNCAQKTLEGLFKGKLKNGVSVEKIYNSDPWTWNLNARLAPNAIMSALQLVFGSFSHRKTA